MANNVTIDVRVDQHGNFNGITAQLNDLTGAAQGAASAIGEGGPGGGGASGAMSGLGAAVGLSALPAIGALIPMMAGAGAGAVAAKLAFSGVGDAVALAGEDQEKYAEALKKMGPEQQEFTKQIVKTKDEFSGFGKEIQKIVLPSFTKAIKDAAPVLKIFKGGVKEMAGVMADFADEFGKLFKSDAFGSALKKNLSMGADFFGKMAKPLANFTQALLDFGAASKPTLDAFGKGIGDLLGKGLPGFFQGLQSGIEGSAKMFDGLFGALNRLLPALGELSGAVADSLGPTFGQLFELIGEQGERILKILTVAFKALKPVFNEVTAAIGIFRVALSAVWDIATQVGTVLLESLWPSFREAQNAVGPLQKLKNWLDQNKVAVMEFTRQAASGIIDFVAAVIDGIPDVIKIFRIMSTGLLEGFGAIIHGAATAFGWIPGLGGKLKSADRSFRTFKDSFIDGLQDAENKSRDFAAKVGPRLSENKLKMNISNWTNQIAESRRQLKLVPDEKKAKLRADIADLQAKVRAAQRQVNALHGKTVTVNYVGKYSGFAGGALTRAHGGVIGSNMAAGGGPRSRLTLVGEHGPELAELPTGTNVHSNPDSVRMMNGAGGGGNTPFVITIMLGETRLTDLLVDPMRKSVQKRGGVQAAFGKL